MTAYCTWLRQACALTTFLQRSPSSPRSPSRARPRVSSVAHSPPQECEVTSRLRLPFGRTACARRRSSARSRHTCNLRDRHLARLMQDLHHRGFGESGLSHRLLAVLGPILLRFNRSENRRADQPGSDCSCPACFNEAAETTPRSGCRVQTYRFNVAAAGWPRKQAERRPCSIGALLLQ